MGRISSSDNTEQWRKSQKRHTGLIHAYEIVDRHGAEKQGAEPEEKGHGREQRCQRLWLNYFRVTALSCSLGFKVKFQHARTSGANDVWHAISVCVLRLQVEQGAWQGESNGEYYTPPSAPSCTGRDAQAEVYRARHAEQTHPNNKPSMDAKIQYKIDL